MTKLPYDGKSHIAFGLILSCAETFFNI